MEKIKLLLAEDETILAEVVRETLEPWGFEIMIASNGALAWDLFQSFKPDICVVDIMMPRKDGLSLVTDIRKVNEDIPIIFLTAKSQTSDVITGLETGADDYMKKPFSMEELMLRVKKLVRKAQRLAPVNTVYTPVSIGAYTFNYTRLELQYADEAIQLSQREAELLHLLAGNKNNLLDRKEALLKIWGEDDPFNARSMDVYITRLRKYLSQDGNIQIINVRGRGYKLIA
jgi:two-component system, OmpR family, response regulator TrcR